MYIKVNIPEFIRAIKNPLKWRNYYKLQFAVLESWNISLDFCSNKRFYRIFIYHQTEITEISKIPIYLILGMIKTIMINGQI